MDSTSLVRLTRQITFRQKSYSPTSITLQITNKIEEPIAYKIKTNRKDKYFISPFEGLIDPWQSAAIVLAIEPETSNRDRDVCDKLLIQAVRCDQPGLNVTKLWSQLEKRDRNGQKCFNKAVFNCQVETLNRIKRIKKMTLVKAEKKKKRFPQKSCPPSFQESYWRRGNSESRFPQRLIVEDEQEMSEPPPFRRDPGQTSYSVEPFNHRRNFSNISLENCLEPPDFPPRMREFLPRTVEGVKHYLSSPMNSCLRIEEKLSFLRRQRISDDIIINALRSHLTD